MGFAKLGLRHDGALLPGAEVPAVDVPILPLGIHDPRLNGIDLGGHAGEERFEHEVTRLLRPRNELVVDTEGTAGRGHIGGEIALEVRCTAFLRDARVWVEGVALHAAGLVVGEADRPLDLYVLLDGSTVSYTTIAAAPAGAAFHIIAERPPSRGKTGEPCLAQVDLVNGAVVWYTTAQELPPGG